MNYAHLDVLAVLMNGMGINPEQILNRYNPKDLAKYRNDYTLDDSVYWLAKNYAKQGIPFDAIAEKVLNIPKSTFYRRAKNHRLNVKGVIVGNEYYDTLWFLAAGVKHARAEFRQDARRLDQLMNEPFQPPTTPAHKEVIEPEQEQEVKKEDDGVVKFTF